MQRELPRMRTESALVGPAKYTLALLEEDVPLVRRELPVTVRPTLDTVSTLEVAAKL